MGNGFYDWWGGNQNDFMKLNPATQNTIGGRYNNYTDGLAGNKGTAGLFTGDDGQFSGTQALGTVQNMAGLANSLFGEGGLFGGSRQLDAMEKGLDAQIAANKRGFNAMATQQRNNVARYNGYNGNRKNDKEIVKNV